MIQAVANTKGGVGKSLFACHILCSEISKAGKDFDMYELDAKNVSTTIFSNSKILDGRGKSLSVNNATNAIGEAIFQSIAENKEIIIDIGGGTDTDIVMEELAQSGEPIRYYVPIQSRAAQIENVRQTFDMIEHAGGKPNLVINFSMGWDKGSSGAVDIFGDATLGISPDKEILKRTESIYFIPQSVYFAHAEREHELIGDFIQNGSIAVDDAKRIIMEWVKTEAIQTGESAMNLFAKRWTQWQEIRKAHEFYQRIAAQNILGM
jgi:hypothetical protein